MSCGLIMGKGKGIIGLEPGGMRNRPIAAAVASALAAEGLSAVAAVAAERDDEVSFFCCCCR